MNTNGGRRHRVDLIFFDAGGGHRAAAMALCEAAAEQGCGWNPNPINLRALLGPIDFIRNTTGVRFEDFYNGLLKFGWTVGTGAMLRFAQKLIAFRHREAVELLARHWRVAPPALVVSLVPNFNRAIFEGLRAADYAARRPPTPMVTIMTDFADYPPHFWIEPQEQYLICGSAHAVEQALETGYTPQRIMRVSGMVIRPAFYRPQTTNRDYGRRRLGLSADLPTGLVMFGGFGSRQMIAIARRIAAAKVKTQLIFLCGHNHTVKARLSALRLPFPHHIEGFTPRPEYFMHLADYFVGKPGPGSLSEAWQMGLPVIVERNARTMVQERYNTDWIERQKLGIVVSSFRKIAQSILPLLDPVQLMELRARVTAKNNRAVFEIPRILDVLIAAPRSGVKVNSDAVNSRQSASA